eukprot:6110495-Amphidinium_carterae.1
MTPWGTAQTLGGVSWWWCPKSCHLVLVATQARNAPENCLQSLRVEVYWGFLLGGHGLVTRLIGDLECTRVQLDGELMAVRSPYLMQVFSSSRISQMDKRDGKMEAAVLCTPALHLAQHVHENTSHDQKCVHPRCTLHTVGCLAP